MSYRYFSLWVMALLVAPNCGFADPKPKISDEIKSLIRRSTEIDKDISDVAATMAEMNRARLQAQIQSGVGPASAPSKTELTCLEMLSEGVVRLDGRLWGLYVATVLADAAIAPADRTNALQMARSLAEATKDMTSHTRSATNTASGTCPQSVIVNQKSQVVLQLAADTETALNNFFTETKGLVRK